MKKYEERMKNYEGNMKNYERNVKKYERKEYVEKQIPSKSGNRNMFHVHR